MVYEDILNQIEADFIVKLQHAVRTPWLDRAMTTFTGLGDSGAIAIAVCGILLLSDKYRNVGLRAAFSLSLEAFVVNMLLKPIVRRPRPYTVDAAVELLARAPRDFSFPSGHTGSVAAVAAVIILCAENGKYKTAAAVAAVLMAFSRIYVGAHYPTDVMASLVIGFATAVFSVKSMDKICKKEEHRWTKG